MTTIAPATITAPTSASVNKDNNIMQAWTFTSAGPPSKVLKLSTLPKPTTSTLLPTQVLVKVTHVGLFTLYAILMRELPHLTSAPWIPEFQFSGIVEAVGAKVTRVAPGDQVFGGQDPATHLRSGGTVREWLVTMEGLVVKLPEGVEGGLEGVAGLAPVGCTAIQFVEKTSVQKGMKVLITGAATLTGLVVVQVVKEKVGESGRVVGTCRAGESAELVRDLGVDEVIDYKTVGVLHKHLIEHHSNEPFDVIIDIAGSDNQLYDKSPAYLTNKGTFLFAGKINITHSTSAGMLGKIAFVLEVLRKTNWPTILGGTPRGGLLHSGRVNAESLDEVAELLRSGHLKFLVNSVFEMADILEAYEKAASDVKGNVVLRVQ